MKQRRRQKLDDFHWHEALDRSLLAFEFFSENVEQHIAVQNSVDLKREAKEISDRMFRLYQSIGAKTLAER